MLNDVLPTDAIRLTNVPSPDLEERNGCPKAGSEAVSEE